MPKTFFGRCASDQPGDDSVQVDLTALIRNLVLFDTYILESIRLKELPHLVHAFGLDGLSNLLQSGALRIHCDAFTFGQTGQLAILESRRQRGILPLGSYSISTIRQANRETYIEKCLTIVDQMTSFQPKLRSRIKEVITSTLIGWPENFGAVALAQLKGDLANNAPVAKLLVAKSLAAHLNKSAPGEFNMRIRQLGDADFRVESDIGPRFGMDDRETHGIVERGLLGVGGLNQRIESMQVFSAVTGFAPEEVSVLGGKLSFLMNPLLTEEQQKTFQRVLDIHGLPGLDRVDAHTKVDAAKLLEIRVSPECKGFRYWLHRVQDASDVEIREAVDGLKSRLSSFVHQRAGTSVRLLVTTGIGFVPVVGNILGPTLGLLDRFLLEKLIPYSGPAAFINRLYPSIFERD
jgi:hypothetical protein